MNAGFSNFKTLKAQLAPTLKSDISFDKVILAIGLGIAGQFERKCNRRFGYLANEVEQFNANYCEFILRRTPLYQVTGWQVKYNEQKGWKPWDVTNIRSIDLPNGIINTGDHDVGPYFAQVQFTYSGGYFWEQAEPDDNPFPTPAPAGVETIPNDLVEAWLLQCRHVWKNTDKMGTDILKGGADASIRFPEAFQASVATMLAPHVRYKLV